ncbi:hypothetical protein [Benzoatithermus flavus]|uniref:Uncharacterized protein n=1 Tax=Benzoatithermus flavus TaxID=3108223 RepID=A0ABU8XKK7_9PROT
MGALNSLATLGLNLALGQQAQRVQNRSLREQRDRQIEQIRLRDAEARREQELALKRRLAEERARAGAAGVGSTGGAADAILSGLALESRQAEAARARQSALRIDEIRKAYDGRRRSNLLDFTGRWLAYGRSGGRSRSLLD